MVDTAVLSLVESAAFDDTKSRIFEYLLYYLKAGGSGLPEEVGEFADTFGLDRYLIRDVVEYGLDEGIFTMYVNGDGDPVVGLIDGVLTRH